MNIRCFIKSNPTRRGWTLVEMLLILAVIVFLGAIATCMMNVRNRKAAKPAQADTLRQIDFPYKTWAMDSTVQTVPVVTGKFACSNVSYYVGAGVLNLASNGNKTNR